MFLCFVFRCEKRVFVFRGCKVLVVFFRTGGLLEKFLPGFEKRFRLTYPSEFRVQVWVMVRGSGSRLRSLGRMMVQGVGLLRYCVVGFNVCR